MINLVQGRCSPTKALHMLIACIGAAATVFILATAELPPVYIFGDSTADVGTNNFLLSTKAKGNFPYNGIDYPNSTATGRFSNGYNIADEIAKQIGYEESPPPFLYLQSQKESDISKGANFASAGSGILYDTGFQTWIEVIPLGDQIKQFATIKGNMTVMFGPNITADILSKSLFLMVIGSNDILDYWRHNWNYSKLEVLSLMRSTYRTHLKNLYDMGARRFGFVGVPPVGCCPYARALQNNSGGCVKELNELARAFHPGTRTLLRSMSRELPGMKYSLGNSYELTKSIMKQPQKYGIKDFKTACCGLGKFNGENFCVKFFSPNICSNHDEHLFWDLYHPSQVVAKFVAASYFDSSSGFVYPISFSQLME